jgi:hypothetical protein
VAFGWTSSRLLVPRGGILTLGYITIVTPIKPGQDNNALERLESYLRAEVAPSGPDASGGSHAFIQCQKSFPFDEIKELHFCSMLILRGVDQSDPTDPACLVFEATFDGSREEFLDDILRVAPEGMHTIYGYCVGYPGDWESHPQIGLAAPALFKEYLLQHDVGVNTFYSGSPGCSVAQVHGEQKIRDDIVGFTKSRRLSYFDPTNTSPSKVAALLRFGKREKPVPTTLLELQRELQHEVIRNRTHNRWAEQPVVVPWEIARRSTISALMSWFVLLVALVIGGLIAWLFGIADIGDRVLPLLTDLLSTDWPLPRFFLIGFLIAIFVWYLLRFSEYLLAVCEDPRDYSFWPHYFAYFLFIVRTALLVPIFAFVTLLAFAPTLSPWWVGIPVLFILLLFWLMLRNWATSIEIKLKFQKLMSSNELARNLKLETVRFFALIALSLLLAGMVQQLRHLPFMPEWILFWQEGILYWKEGNLVWQYGIESFVSFSLTVAFYILIAIFTAYILVGILFLVVRHHERSDRKRYDPATNLITGLDTAPSIYDREGSGVHKYQNHLASLTYVKPGWLRLVMLRITLFSIGLLARFWFNRGELGGISTILAARWVIIKGSNGMKRLLFLTNYTGEWGSYLNEFIDMGAVKGVNAIWSNTFVNFWSNSKPTNSASRTKSNNSKDGYAFPETRFIVAKGAQAEKPFKAYVRQSQIETLVWYSGYPKLTTVNINANSGLRQALFRPLAACELDQVFRRAGL